MVGFEPISCNSPVDCCLPPARRRQLLDSIKSLHPVIFSSHPNGMVFLLAMVGFEPFSCNSPVDCCLPPARRRQHLDSIKSLHPAAFISFFPPPEVRICTHRRCPDCSCPPDGMFPHRPSRICASRRRNSDSGDRAEPRFCESPLRQTNNP